MALPITGKILLRDVYVPKGETSPAPKGKKLMMFTGIVCVPEDTEIKGEHQYIVYGQEQEDLRSTGLVIMNDSAEDLTKQVAGYDIGSTLKMPIWRF